ncbi:hypothetical protein [Pseudomonas sp. FW300-N2A2]|uniref:hypothetical protein n=1 Tax=Pseudomonas sp. FW300-N2A2 TaxID=2751316 RepID=UPI001A91B1E9|nr:hypothetical protein [Pseudomonas sp. FW300-N2A2]
MKARDDGKAYAQDVTLEELGDFLGMHDLNKAGCQYCGGKEWDLPAHEDKPVIIKLPTPSNHPDGINAFFMSCANCGRMETFLTQTVVSRLMGWD